MQRSAPAPVLALVVRVPGLSASLIAQHERERGEPRIQLFDSLQTPFDDVNGGDLPGSKRLLEFVDCQVVELIPHRCLPKDMVEMGSVFRNASSSRMTTTRVARLKEAGAVIVGKMNMHTLGMGTTGLESCFGPAQNPWNEDFIPGGSSSGSAAAVAAGLCYATLHRERGDALRARWALRFSSLSDGPFLLCREGPCH